MLSLVLSIGLAGCDRAPSTAQTSPTPAAEPTPTSAPAPATTPDSKAAPPPASPPNEAEPSSTSCQRTMKRGEFDDGRWELGRLTKGGLPSSQKPRRDRMVTDTKDVILAVEEKIASAPEVTLPCDEVDEFREAVKKIHALNTELFGESTRPSSTTPTRTP